MFNRDSRLLIASSLHKLLNFNQFLNIATTATNIIVFLFDYILFTLHEKCVEGKNMMHMNILMYANMYNFL